MGGWTIAVGIRCSLALVFGMAGNFAYFRFMANCYICGRPLNESRYRLRRKVKTGEWIRRCYRIGKAVGVATRNGPRIVCKGCAKRIDWQDRRSERMQWLQLGFWLLVLLLLLGARI